MTLAYHSDPAVKARLLSAIKADQEADAILQGAFLTKNPDNPVGFTGCAVGCAVAAFRGTVSVDDWHGELEKDAGIPKQINYIIDGTFENLASEVAPQFVYDVFDAIPVAADLSLVVSNLMLDVLVGEPYGLIKLPDLANDVKAAVEAIVECYRRRLVGNEPTEREWQVAGELARAAWDAWDARAAYYPWLAERLIEHLANAPVGGPA